MSKIMSEYTDEDILYEYETVGDLIENKSLKTWWNTLNIDIRTPIKRLREAVTSLSTLARANNKNIANKTRMIQTKFKKNVQINLWILRAWSRRIHFYIQNIKYLIACSKPIVRNSPDQLIECLGCGNSMKPQMFFCRQYLTSLRVANNAQHQWSDEHTVCIWCKNWLWAQLPSVNSRYDRNVKQFLRDIQNQM